MRRQPCAPDCSTLRALRRYAKSTLSGPSRPYREARLVGSWKRLGTRDRHVICQLAPGPFEFSSHCLNLRFNVARSHKPARLRITLLSRRRKSRASFCYSFNIMALQRISHIQTGPFVNISDSYGRHDTVDGNFAPCHEVKCWLVVSLFWMTTLIHELLRSSAERRPAARALGFKQTTVSYEVLAGLAADAAQSSHRRGASAPGPRCRLPAEASGDGDQHFRHNDGRWRVRARQPAAEGSTGGAHTARLRRAHPGDHRTTPRRTRRGDRELRRPAHDRGSRRTAARRCSIVRQVGHCLGRFPGKWIGNTATG